MQLRRPSFPPVEIFNCFYKFLNLTESIECTRADPDRTLAQGSVIQASLQTAINSDLPGNVVAVVSEPVPAFSGDRILIPRGSRLFGQYRSGIEVNQKRILILWTRILTPDGTSINISAVGGDQLGRSGLTGLVDTKFLERFGGAALISIIGAAPSVAAERVQDETAADVLANIGSDLSDATTRPWGLNPPRASGTPKPKRNAAKAQARRRMQKESRRRNRR